MSGAAESLVTVVLESDAFPGVRWPDRRVLEAAAERLLARGESNATVIAALEALGQAPAADEVTFADLRRTYGESMARRQRTLVSYRTGS